MSQGKLVFFSGKMGSGKTTLAKKLSNTSDSIYLSEDDMLSTLYPNEIHDINDYKTYSIRIKPFVLTLVKQLIDSGLTVVMDFPANTLKQRAWFKNIINETGVQSSLIYVKASDELCIKHILKRRKEAPHRHRFDNEEMFYKISAYFEPPTEKEGFQIDVVESSI